MKQIIRLAAVSGALLVSLAVTQAHAVTAQCTFDDGKVAKGTCTGSTVPTCDFKTKKVKCGPDPAKATGSPSGNAEKPTDTADKPKK